MGERDREFQKGKLRKLLNPPPGGGFKSPYIENDMYISLSIPPISICISRTFLSLTCHDLNIDLSQKMTDMIPDLFLIDYLTTIAFFRYPAQERS